jgi:hypothetical protein
MTDGDVTGDEGDRRESRLLVSSDQCVAQQRRRNKHRLATVGVELPSTATLTPMALGCLMKANFPSESDVNGWNVR